MHPFVHLSIGFWLYTALQCRSSMSSNCLVFHTSGGISSSPAAFLFLIFLRTESSSSCVNGPSLMSNCLLIKNYRKNPTNTNALKLKTAQYQLAGIYIKEQIEYIQNQIDKIRDSVEDRQSRIAWQTINEVSRRKNTAKAKLKAANQQERIKLWKQHFENLLGNPPKITHEPYIYIYISASDCIILAYTYLPTPPPRQDMTQGQFLTGV